MPSPENRQQRRRRRFSRHEHDPSRPHLAILLEKRPSGFAHVHAGIARYRKGATLCSDRLLPVFGIPAEDPNFATYRTEGWRHRYAEAFLELNRGCPDCLEILYRIGREAGYAVPRSLERY